MTLEQLTDIIREMRKSDKDYEVSVEAEALAFWVIYCRKSYYKEFMEK